MAYLIIPRIVAGVTVASYLFSLIGAILIPVAHAYADQSGLDENYGSKLFLAISSLVLYLMIGCIGTVWLAIHRGYQCRLRCSEEIFVQCFYVLPCILIALHIIVTGILLGEMHYYRSFDLVLIYGTILDVLVLLSVAIALLIFMGWLSMRLCCEVANLYKFLCCTEAAITTDAVPSYVVVHLPNTTQSMR